MAGLAAQMHAASHAYSRRVRRSLTSLCLRRQGSLLRCRHHTYSQLHHIPTRVGAPLAYDALPTTAGLAAQMPASHLLA
eukprot:scaffold49539_cov66-Phaeocystis_antarctica.AAC.3